MDDLMASPAMQEIVDRVVARTDKIEAQRMVNGEEEVLPPMTLEEFDTFLTEEDARLRDAIENARET